MTYNTGNPVPSSDARDLLDNAVALDKAISSTAPTFTDRLGNERTTLFRAVELGMANYRIYPSQAAGLAATAAGEYFAVPANLSTEYLVLFRNESGVAVEKKRLPSAQWIAALEGRIGTAESDIDSLDTRATALESRATTLEGQTTSLTGRTTSLENRTDTAESDIDSLDTRATALESRATSAENSINGLDGRADTAETDITSLKQRATSLEARTTLAEGDIDSLEARLDDMAGLVAAAGTAAESAEQSAGEALQKANEAATDAAEAQASAQAAQDAADSAVAVVTGGTASLTPEPGKIPIADGDAVIDPDWVGFDGGTALEVLDNAKTLFDYVELRAYSGRATGVRLAKTGIAGQFYRDDTDTTSADNGITVIVDGIGRRWRRLLDGAVDVRMAGAAGDGVTSDTDAFRRAAAAATGYNINPDVYAAVPNPPFAVIAVPVGHYVLSSDVPAYGKDLVWILQTGAKITGIDYLTGRVMQDGVRISGNHRGILDHAVSFAVHANSAGGYGKPASILGITDPSQLSSYTDRDSVGFYVENDGPPPITIASATYTATTIIPDTPVDVDKLSVGMIIDTAHAPTKYSGFISSWAADGSSITVTAWYECTGSSVPASTPPNGPGAYVNPFTKIWAINANLSLRSASHASSGAGFELGLVNEKAQLTNPGDTSKHIWGYDVVNFGPYNTSVGFIQRGPFLRGFESRGAVFDGYTVLAQGSAYPVTAFSVRCNSYEQFACRPDGTDATQTATPVFRVTNVGDIDCGSSTSGSTRTWKLRSSGLTSDYDTRLQSIGGTSTPAQGTFRITAQFVEVVGTLRASADGTYPLGSYDKRYSQVWAVNGSIQTSDEDAKTDIAGIPDAVLDAWALVNFQQFRFKDAVEAKGDGARLHVGVIAQRVKEAFEAKGLDPFAYGLLCYDEWDEQPEIVDEWEDQYADILIKQEETVEHPATETSESWVEVIPAISERQLIKPAGREVVQEYRQAGSRYGIRYDEALALEAALMRRTTSRLAARIADLEAR